MPLRRTLLRSAVAGVVVGTTFVGAALAGVVASPVDDVTDVTDGLLDRSTPAEAPEAPGTAPDTGGSAPTTAATGLQVGASKVSIAPRPNDYGGTWETDPAACRTMDPGYLQRLGTNPEDGEHWAHTGSPWPENPNCIYQGGFSIGPANPVTAFDTELGLWVRSVAIGDGADTVVLTIVDGEGWLWDYASKCDDCGAKQLGEELGEELDIDPAGIVIAATHAHAAPDFIGGWGFVPDWYMTQVTEAIRQSVTEAVGAMEAAVVEYGEVMARQFNSERRGTYRSAEEQQLGWLRAYVPGEPGRKKHDPGTPARVIATLGTYAAHPTQYGTNGNVAHPDWPGVFERGLEERFGGVGLHFMTGLGTMSRSGPVGPGLAALVPPVGEGTPITTAKVTAEQAVWNQPATNVPLSALGLPGFFDRQFVSAPSSVNPGKSSNAPCVSASPVSVEVAASAITIGDRELAITAGPGELFSNLTNAIKEETLDKGVAKVTLPLAQANDALGYMPQSFELNPVGQQGLGFGLDGFVFVNYEDSYAIDRCFGDMTLETTLQMLGAK